MRESADVAANAASADLQRLQIVGAAVARRAFKRKARLGLPRVFMRERGYVLLYRDCAAFLVAHKPVGRSPRRSCACPRPAAAAIPQPRACSTLFRVPLLCTSHAGTLLDAQLKGRGAWGCVAFVAPLLPATVPEPVFEVTGQQPPARVCAQDTRAPARCTARARRPCAMVECAWEQHLPSV